LGVATLWCNCYLTDKESASRNQRAIVHAHYLESHANYPDTLFPPHRGAPGTARATPLVGLSVTAPPESWRKRTPPAETDALEADMSNFPRVGRYPYTPPATHNLPPPGQASPTPSTLTARYRVPFPGAHLQRAPCKASLRLGALRRWAARAVGLKGRARACSARLTMKPALPAL